MRKIGVFSLGLAVALSTGILLASSAWASIAFVAKVGGAELKAGETKGFTASRDGIADIHGSVGGVAILMLSNKGKVASGAKIIGGKPATGEEILELESVKVDNPAGCVVESLPSPVVGTIRTALLKTEIVEGQSGTRGNGEPLILATPKEGTSLTTIRFLNATGETCPVNLAEGGVEGNFLGLPLPQKTEVTRVAGVEEAITHEYLVAAGGAVKTAGLKFAGSAATITGLVLVVLESGQAFGAF